MKTQTCRTLACTALSLGIPLLAFANDHSSSEDAAAQLDSSSRKISSPLVEKVRAATRRYKNIEVAIAEGWVPATPCVSGPNSGAMGVHYVLPERVGDAVLSADVPEALIYEPLRGGGLQLVGVEFIVIAEVWNSANPTAQATLDGHLLNLVGEPNRYRLPAFYELHVWAWERNPDGNFSDWNTLVTCQTGRRSIEAPDAGLDRLHSARNWPSATGRGRDNRLASRATAEPCCRQRRPVADRPVAVGQLRAAVKPVECGLSSVDGARRRSLQEQLLHQRRQAVWIDRFARRSARRRYVRQVLELGQDISGITIAAKAFAQRFVERSGAHRNWTSHSADGSRRSAIRGVAACRRARRV